MNITVNHALGLSRVLSEIKDFPTLSHSFNFAKMKNELRIVQEAYDNKNRDLIVSLGVEDKNKKGNYKIETLENQKKYAEIMNKYLFDSVDLNLNIKGIKDIASIEDFDPKSSSKAYHDLFMIIDDIESKTK